MAAKKKPQTTVAEYLASLEPDKRAAVAALATFVRKHIPAGYEEAMSWGVISWQIPLARFPNTYNGHPLTYIGLGSRKNYNTLYLMGEYGDQAQDALRKKFALEGKKLDMGKSCVHFKTMDDLALVALAESIKRTTPEAYIARYESVKRKK